MRHGNTGTAPPSPSSPSRLTAAPDPFFFFKSILGTQQHPSSPPSAPVTPGSQSLGQGESVYLRALLWVFQWSWLCGKRSTGPSLFLSPQSALEFVMPRSCCRLPWACALLVAGGETWKQQKQNKKNNTNEHRIRLKRSDRHPVRGRSNWPGPLHTYTLLNIYLLHKSSKVVNKSSEMFQLRLPSGDTSNI